MWTKKIVELGVFEVFAFRKNIQQEDCLMTVAISVNPLLLAVFINLTEPVLLACEALQSLPYIVLY